MNRKIFLLGILLLASTLLHAQSGVLTGKIFKTGTRTPVDQALVSIPTLNLSATTNAKGYFEIQNVPYGKHLIKITRANYDDYTLEVEVNSPRTELSSLTILRPASSSDLAPDISIVMLDMEDETKDQSVSGLLQASDDVFASNAGYIFGSMFFKTRGYDSENGEVLISNADVSDPENGRITWSNWGGLNDAMRNREVYYGASANPFSYGTFSGMTYLNTRASDYRKQLKLSYSLTDRTYRNRLMLTYSTGALENGWAFTVSGSRRWSQEGYISATFYDAWSYFAAAEKKLGKKHSIALSVFGAPTERGQSAASMQETKDLAGTNYYNPNWGYQNGDKRNARVKQFHEPVFILNHYWDMNDKTRLTTTASYSFGEDNWTSLSWFNAADPRPDYYRYLPSYYKGDPRTQEIIRNNWANDPSVSQIDWDRLYQINYLGNLTNQPARYIVEKNIVKTNNFNFNSFLRREVSNHITVTGGLNVKVYKGDHYKVVDDLLGANYWLDIDQYAQRDFPGDSATAQNDLDNPNRKVTKGEKFGYHYAAFINRAGIWGQAEFSYNKFDFYAALSIGGVQYWREGYMKNGRHPDNSFGKSTVYDFLNAGVKGGFTYKITGRHFAYVNGFYQSRAPFYSNFFVSPRVRDDVVPSIVNENIYGGDINYAVRYPWLKGRLTYYYTRFTDVNEINSFYHDDYQTYVNLIMSGIDKYHHGLEFGAEVKATKRLSVIGVAAIGEYRYSNRPNTTIAFDNGSRPDTTTTTYIKNFFIPQTPQTAATIGLKYNINFWYFNFNANFFDNNYADFNPERRSQLAIANLGPGDPLIREITQQEKLKGGITLDASIGKSIRIQRKYFININLSVTNLLDNKDIQSGGYEQNRFDFETKDIGKFLPKYYNYFGRTFFLNVNFRI